MQAITKAQTTATIIRTARTAQKVHEGSVQFRERQAEVAALLDTILNEGQQEVEAGSSAYCTNYRMRPGFIGDERCTAQVTRHAAGYLIRFWVYPGNFEVRVRDLALLPSEVDKGWDIWLQADGKLFPHAGKYVMPAMAIMGHYFTGR